MASVAASSSMHLHGTVEQALVAAASQVVAAGTAELWDAIVSCQPEPHRAATPRPLPTPATALPASLPIVKDYAHHFRINIKTVLLCF